MGREARTKTPRQANHFQWDMDSEVSFDVLENDITNDFENQDSNNIHLEDLKFPQLQTPSNQANSALSFETRFIWS